MSRWQTGEKEKQQKEAEGRKKKFHSQKDENKKLGFVFEKFQSEDIWVFKIIPKCGELFCTSFHLYKYTLEALVFIFNISCSIFVINFVSSFLCYKYSK